MESHALSLFLIGIKDLYFDMTVEIHNNKDKNTMVQSVKAVLKQEKEFMKERSTDGKFRNKSRVVCERYDCYIYKYLPSKRTCRQGEKYEELFVTLNLKKKSFMWCKCYGDNYMPRIDTLLCHITVRSVITNIQVELMFQPTFGPY